MLSGLAPERIVFSGFVSSSFYMVLSILSLAYIIDSSGLLNRTIKWLLSIIPPRLRILELVMSCFFLLLSGIITPRNIRSQLVLLSLDAMDKTIRFPKRERYLNRLTIVFFFSSFILGASFLTGSSSNLLFYSLLDPVTQSMSGWLAWFVYTLPMTIIILLGSIGIYFFQFKDSIPLVSKEQLPAHKNEGKTKLSVQEKLAMFSIITLIVGIIFSSTTHISAPWVAMSVFFLLILMGLIDSTSFKKEIDWPFLFFLASIIGFSNTMEYLNVTSVIQQNISFLVRLIQHGHIYLLLICVYILNIIFIPLIGIIAPILLLLFLGPSLQAVGASPWVLAATGSLAIMSWITPFQKPLLIYFSEYMTEKKYGKYSALYRTQLYMTVVYFIAFLVSIFYWDYLNLI